MWYSPSLLCTPHSSPDNLDLLMSELTGAEAGGCGVEASGTRTHTGVGTAGEHILAGDALRAAYGIGAGITIGQTG
jgi:hypothetical protein